MYLNRYLDLFYSLLSALVYYVVGQVCNTPDNQFNLLR
jgi:hypothetical protein